MRITHKNLFDTYSINESVNYVYSVTFLNHTLSIALLQLLKYISSSKSFLTHFIIIYVFLHSMPLHITPPLLFNSWFLPWYPPDHPPCMSIGSTLLQSCPPGRHSYNQQQCGFFRRPGTSSGGPVRKPQNRNDNFNPNLFGTFACIFLFLFAMSSSACFSTSKLFAKTNTSLTFFLKNCSKLLVWKILFTVSRQSHSWFDTTIAIKQTSFAIQKSYLSCQ